MIKVEDYMGAKDVMIMGDNKTLIKEFGFIVAGLKNRLPDKLLHEIIDSENVNAFAKTLARESAADYKTFRLRVSHLMEINGYTMQSLAKALNMTFEQLYDALHGGVVPDTILVEKIANLFKVPLDYLFREKHEKTD